MTQTDLAERIREFITIFESRIREYEEIGKKHGMWTANDYLNRSEHQKLVNLLTDCLAALESKPLEDGELQQLYDEWDSFDDYCERENAVATKLIKALHDAFKRKEGVYEITITHNIDAEFLHVYKMIPSDMDESGITIELGDYYVMKIKKEPTK